MISTTFMGGLGNRLFQIAFGLGYETSHPNITYAINRRYIMNYNPGQYGEHSYFMREIPVIDYECPMIYEPNDRAGVYHHFPNVNGLTNFQGYFQSEKYFYHCRDLILQQFGCPESSRTALHSKYPDLSKAAFLHVRRGDYVNHWIHYIDLTDYYKHCISQFPSDTHFYICSDDPDWCQHNMNHVPNSTIIRENEVDTLWLMSLCQRGGICANSTLSWWGGWLNTNKDKRIYYPSRQFNVDWIHSTDLISKDFITVTV